VTLCHICQEEPCAPGELLCLDCAQQVDDGHYERNVAPYEPQHDCPPGECACAMQFDHREEGG
jgi:hypothetical protein